MSTQSVHPLQLYTSIPFHIKIYVEHKVFGEGKAMCISRRRNSKQPKVNHLFFHNIIWIVAKTFDFAFSLCFVLRFRVDGFFELSKLIILVNYCRPNFEHFGKLFRTSCSCCLLNYKYFSTTKPPNSSKKSLNWHIIKIGGRSSYNRKPISNFKIKKPIHPTTYAIVCYYL